MARKKSAVRGIAVRKAEGKTDAELVREAYADAVKRQVDTYFGNCISETSGAEAMFLAGLKIIRTARDRAIELANG